MLVYEQLVGTSLCLSHTSTIAPYGAFHTNMDIFYYSWLYTSSNSSQDNRQTAGKALNL